MGPIQAQLYNSKQGLKVLDGGFLDAGWVTTGMDIFNTKLMRPTIAVSSVAQTEMCP